MKPVICTKVFSCSACLKIYHDNLGCDCAIGAAKPAELIEMRLVEPAFVERAEQVLTWPETKWANSANLEDSGFQKIQFVKSTGSAEWRTKGEQDPHYEHYNCERAKLTLGRYSDDALANMAFMGYDRPLDVDKLVQGDKDYHAPIALMTAVKDRIRWLSRSLEKALADLIASRNENEQLLHRLNKLESNYRKAIDTLSVHDSGLADHE